MKRTLSLIAILAVCLFALAGCQCSHEWAAADCVNPATCGKCGETEGEALGHSWADATCSAPKTCTACGLTEGEALTHSWTEVSCAAPKTCEYCGETQGEALPHTWVEANYQAPKTCSVCGGTEGEPLTASFEANGLQMTESQFDVPHTLTVDGQNITVTLEDHQIFESDANHEALEGYEWHSIKVVLRGEGSVGTNLPVSTDYNNYYDLETFNANITQVETGALLTLQHTVNYLGQDYDQVLFQVDASYMDEYPDHWEYEDSLSFRLPVGFDGIFYCIGDGKLLVGDYQAVYMDLYRDENTLFFRFN